VDEIRGIDIHPAAVWFFASRNHDKFLGHYNPFHLNAQQSVTTHSPLIFTHSKPRRALFKDGLIEVVELSLLLASPF